MEWKFARVTYWQALSTERDGFAKDLLALMTLEEKLGQLDIMHSGADPALEAAISQGRIGGIVCGGPEVSRLQALATGRSRLGIPLLVFPPMRTSGWSPWALAASWDPETCRTAGAFLAQQCRHSVGNALLAPVIASSDNASAATSHLASCDGHLLKKLSAALLSGALEQSGAGEHVLPIPIWNESQPGARQAWVDELLALKIPALDALPGEIETHRRDPFQGLLFAQCRRLEGIVADRFAQTSCRSGVEAAERAIDEGAMTLTELDDAVRGVLAVKHALDLFRFPDRLVPSHDGDLHLELAQAMRRSFVLLRNDGGLLPLSPVTDRILVVGPGDGPTLACTEALNRSGIGHTLAPGLSMRQSRADWAEPQPRDAFAMSFTREAARRTDFVFLVLDERHFFRAPRAAWPQPTEATVQLLQSLSGIEARKVAILNTPWPVDLGPIDSHFAAILQCWTGADAVLDEALGDILVGRTSPQGRMPVSVGLNPLGHGIGYGETIFSKARFTREAATLVVNLRVRNEGHLPTREIVQLYGSRDGGPTHLLGFRSVGLTPGEDVPVSFELALPAGRWRIGVGKDIERTRLVDLADAHETLATRDTFRVSA